MAHVLVELALDAVLLRDTPTLADEFYRDFAAADFGQITRWTETMVCQPLPALPAVLTRFADSRYLYQYGEDEGVATGLSHLCRRARQDTFEGENYVRLVAVVGQTIAAIKGQALGLLEESRAVLMMSSASLRKATGTGSAGLLLSGSASGTHDKSA